MITGIIGGSGLYDIDGVDILRKIEVETPFGSPSDTFVHGTIDGREVYFLPRHGRGHRILPGELNHRANIHAMKQLGVQQILSITAVGSFREEMPPGDLVLVDQFVDRTKVSEQHTFFGDGIVAHIPFAHPTCTHLSEALGEIIEEELAAENPYEVSLHRAGTYVNMEGPAFSTLAESRLYRSWGMDVIGMTNLAEAKLAREAEICYQPLAMVTDFDCWHQTHESVSVEMIIKTLQRNAQLACRIIRRAVPRLAARPLECGCGSTLQFAVITDPAAMPAETRARLALLIDKYLPSPR